MKFKIVIDTDKCKGCELCVNFCEKKCLEMSQDINARGYHFPAVKPGMDSECKGCLRCALMCPDAVIEIEKISS